MLLSEAFNLYRKELRIKGHSPRTDDGYVRTLSSLHKFFGDVSVYDLTFESIRDYIEWLQGKHLSPGCIRLYLNKIRVVLTYLNQRGYDVLDPSNIPLPKKETKVPQFLTPQEVEKLIKVAKKPRNQALISFLYSTGLRVSECLRIDRRDIKEDFFSISNAKNNGTRICFIDSRTRKLLNAYLATRTDQDPALFYSNVKRCRMQHQNVEFMFRRWRKLAGLEGISAHTLRHSFATDLNRNGADIYTISKLLGHSSISSTEVYLHVFNRHLQEDYSKYHTT